jgi:hypothetical protein
MDPIFRITKQSDELFMNYPPIISGEKKAIVYEEALDGPDPISNSIVVSKYHAIMPDDMRSPHSMSIDYQFVEGFFDYKEVRSISQPKLEWHLNFADQRLFVAYCHDIFAQDEIQCAEHPILGSILEMLSNISKESESYYPFIENTDGTPSPILIIGAERRLTIDMNPLGEDGEPVSIYGNRFQGTPDEILQRACIRPESQSASNILAMSSLSYGEGAYSVQEIIKIILIAFTGFRAAVTETQNLLGVESKTVIHSGDWGCGAFGGNKILMASLQLLSADMAGVDTLVFHSTDKAHFETAKEIVRTHWDENGRNLEEFISQVHSLKFQWGMSDGN